MDKLTPHERAIVKETIAHTLFELRMRTRPGSQDSWYHDLGEYREHRGIKAEIRQMIRSTPTIREVTGRP